jgi:Ca2+-binding EF-hand superfamily protein
MKATILLGLLLATPALAQAPSNPPPVPLPSWFVEIDTAKKGEVTREQFLKYRMKSFEELDANKDGKLSLEEFLKLAEPPFSKDAPGGPSLDERRDRARAEFKTMDTDADGFVERGEAEVLVHSEFNKYDTDRDNKVTEPEMRLLVQRTLQRQAAERQQAEARRRQSMMTLNDFIDMQLREADKLDKNNDGRVTQQEYLGLAGPADSAQTKDLPPFEIRKQLVLRRFQEIDGNKDGVLDRVELTAYAVRQFLEIDVNKDRFLTEEELKKAQEAEAARMREIIPTLTPAAPRPAPAPAPAQPAPAPSQGPPAGLPQRTR